MTDEKFTPGPWRIRAHTSRPHDRVVVQANGGSIACVYRSLSGAIDGPPEDEPNEADARLIAAAPELYEALIAIVQAEEAALTEWRDTGGPAWRRGHPAFDRYNAARAALAKAGVVSKQAQRSEDV